MMAPVRYLASNTQARQDIFGWYFVVGWIRYKKKRQNKKNPFSSCFLKSQIFVYSVCIRKRKCTLSTHVYPIMNRALPRAISCKMRSCYKHYFLPYPSVGGNAAEEPRQLWCGCHLHKNRKKAQLIYPL